VFGELSSINKIQNFKGGYGSCGSGEGEFGMPMGIVVIP